MATAVRHEVWMRLPGWDPEAAARLRAARIELVWREAPGAELLNRSIEVSLELEAADESDARRQIERALDGWTRLWDVDFIAVAAA
jgi:hypothetical protein